MSRSGVEPKPAWRAVPEAVRCAVRETLGAEVRRAMRVWGGYSPSPTYRLRLADGRRAFFKAVNPSSNDFSRAAHAREERIYGELGDLIAPWAPELYGAFERDGWQVLLLEDLGPKSAPPWTRALARNVARAQAEFHLSTLGRAMPDWLPGPGRWRLEALRWEDLAAFEGLGPVAALTGEQQAVALRWFEAALPALAQANRGLGEIGAPYALLHNDTRSDNLRWQNGRLRLFDWPHAAIGPAEYDAAGFAQSVTVEGGPEPEAIIAWYGERAPVRPDALDAVVAALAGFFAYHAWRDEVPGLPRLRPFQRQQLAVTLAWAARRLRLPEPTWLSGLAQGCINTKTPRHEDIKVFKG